MSMASPALNACKDLSAVTWA